MQSVPPSGNWIFVLPAQLTVGLRTDPEFAFLVTVSRVVSAMLFGIEALNQYAQKSNDPPKAAGELLLANPRGERQVFEAFLYLTSALHSAFECLDAAEPQLGHLGSFQAVRASLESPQMDDAAVELMQVVRNRAGFHFDPTIASRVVPTLPDTDMVFCMGNGPTRGGMHFTTAWLVTVDFVFGGGKKTKDPDATAARLSKMITAVHDVGSSFVRVAIDQIMQRLSTMGFEVISVPPGDESSRTQAQSR